MRHIWGLAVDMSTDYEYHQSHRRLSQMPESNPATIQEDSALADVRRLIERTSQIGSPTPSEEQRQLIKKFRGERLRIRFKQLSAAGVFLVSLYLAWGWASGGEGRFTIALVSLLTLVPALIKLIAYISLGLGPAAITLFMIWHKIEDPDWEVGWFLIILLAAFSFMVPALGFPVFGSPVFW